MGDFYRMDLETCISLSLTYHWRMLDHMVTTIYKRSQEYSLSLCAQEKKGRWQVMVNSLLNFSKVIP